MIGKTISHYKILEKLGEGGMGVVYKAEDTKLKRTVALKFLPPELTREEEAKERFVHEAQSASALQHNNICTIHDIDDTDDGQMFICMDYYDGETLKKKIERGPLSVEEAIDITTQIARGLERAHEQKIVHRDIKPANLMVTSDGVVKIVDFGLAKLAGKTTVTKTGTTVGTVAYMSPEQARGEALDHRTDIWALGVVLYEMLTGQLPFKGDYEQAVVYSILNEKPEPVAAVRRLRDVVPAGVEQALMKALAKIPANRFASAVAFAEALSKPAVVRPSPRSIAVLPFLNLSADRENEYFTDGITEDVIAQLSMIGALKVISRTSVMLFKKQEQSLREIAARLGVETVLEGSVRRAGDRVRIVAQLIDAETDQHLWAETYDRQLTDIFAIQSDVALHIAAALKAELSPDERTRIGKEPTSDLEAYQLYLKGRHCLYRYTQEGIRKGLEYFERAIEKDPNYALAYVSVALSYVILGLGYGAGAIRPDEAYRRAKEAVAKALEINSGLGEAHGILGFLKFASDFDWTGAEREFKRAIELNPGAMTHDTYGLMLSALERYEEAIATQKRAQELDPLMAVHSSDLASTLLRAGRYDEALQQAKRLIELEPDFPMGHSTLGWAYLKKGRRDEGLAELEKAVSLSPGNTILLAQLGQAYALAGKVGEAREVLQQLEELSRQRYVSPYHMAYVYTGLGEQDKAIDWLEQAYEERAGGVYGIKGSFLFTTLRSHPRFTALLRKMNLD